MARHLDLTGGCHCGIITFTLSWPEKALPLRARSCTCNFCIRHNSRYTSHPKARLSARLADQALVSRYRFGTGSADFLICKRCGILPLLTTEIGGKTYGLVNVNTLDDQSVIAADVPAMTFEGEELGDRVQRRKKNWIPRVKIS